MVYRGTCKAIADLPLLIELGAHLCPYHRGTSNVITFARSAPTGSIAGTTAGAAQAATMSQACGRIEASSATPITVGPSPAPYFVFATLKWALAQQDACCLCRMLCMQTMSSFAASCVKPHELLHTGAVPPWILIVLKHA